MDFDTIVALGSFGALLLLPLRAILDEVRDSRERKRSHPRKTSPTERWRDLDRQLNHYGPDREY